MDTTRESVRKFVWDEEDRLLGVDLRPESSRKQPHIAAYTYDASGERGIRYVPRQQETEQSGSSASYAQDMDIILYPNALITVRPQEFPEDFDPMSMNPKHVYTTYTKHYYIGSERINSKLGTINNLGLLCEEIGANDLIRDMNTKVRGANRQLNKLYEELDKELEIAAPYLYSENHRLVCNIKAHNPKLYDAYWYHPDHLGSSSFITNTTGEISQHMEYLPFGETLVEEHLNSYNSPFKFNGKEYDAETGNYYYGARYMNPKWSTFLTPDPALESYPGISPYAYTLNNPVRYVDPTGMYVEENPIYDTKGDFLGTDDLGIQGEAIIMNKSDFKQGMSHEDALSKGTLRSELPMVYSQDFYDKIDTHHLNLPSRPDWDGHLTLEEANDWYRNGGGQPLFTDLSKIDLSGIYSLGENYVGQVKTFNLLLNSNSLNDGLVYGNITLKRYPNNQVRAFADRYDFEMHNPKNPLNWSRNAETVIGRKVAGEGTPFEINIHGSATLKPLFPWIK